MKKAWLYGWVLAGVLVTLYSVSVGHNFFFDEENIILRNPYIRDWSQFSEIFRHGYFRLEGKSAGSWIEYYRPLTTLTFALDYQVWKLNPLGYNLTNIVWHLLVCMALFSLILKITADEQIAFFTSLLFAVHPIHTEAVTYLASRGDLLAAAFTLLAVLFYWNGRTWASALCYGLGLLSKESAFLTPLYLGLVEFCFLKSSARAVLKKGALFVSVTATYFIFRKAMMPVPLELASWDAQVAALRFFSMGPALLRYLQSLLWPASFRYAEGVSFAPSFLDVKVLISTGLFLLLGMWLWRTSRKKGALFFGLGFFLVGMLPYSQIVPFYPHWAEHYLYVPSMGLVILVAAALRWARIQPKVGMALVAFIYLFFFVLFFVRTWQRNVVFSEDHRFYQRLSQSRSVYAFVGYQNLARLAMEQEQWPEAGRLLQTALKLGPNSDANHGLLAAWHFHENQFSKSAEHFKKAYTLSGNAAYLADAGSALVRMRDIREAVRVLQAALSVYPRNLSSRINLMQAYEISGDLDKLLECASEGVRLHAEDAMAVAVLHLSAARAAYRQGRDELMRAELETVTACCPDVFWLSDVAGLLKLQVSEQAFASRHGKYLAMDPSARDYILMKRVLAGQCRETASFLKEGRASWHRRLAKEPLLQAEYRRAHRLLKGCL